MKTQDIEDVLDVSAILLPIWTDDAPSLASLVATLIDWRDSSFRNEVRDFSNEVVATVVDKPKTKRGKAATTSDPSVSDVTDDEPDF